MYRTGTGLYGQASGEFSLRIFGDLPLLTVVDYGHYRGPPDSAMADQAGELGPRLRKKK